MVSKNLTDQNEVTAPKPVELASTDKINRLLKSGGVKQGLEVKTFFKLTNASWAFSGRGPLFQGESFRVSLVRGLAMVEKCSIVPRKKEQRPRNCLTSLTVVGATHSLIAFVLASPSLIPLSCDRLYPR